MKHCNLIPHDEAVAPWTARAERTDDGAFGQADEAGNSSRNLRPEEKRRGTARPDPAQDMEAVHELRGAAGAAFPEGRWSTLARALFLTLVAVCAATWPAAGADRRWTGDAFNNTWSEPGNWNPSGTPQDGDTLRFGNLGSQKNNNNLSNLRVQSIVFDGSSGGYTLNGNSIRLNADITAAHASGFNRVRFGVGFTSGGGTFSVVNAGRLEIGGDVTLSQDGLLGIYTLGTNLTISGAIVGDGGVEKHGEGSLFLTGNAANTYTRETTIRRGAVYLAKPSGARAISSRLSIGENSPFLCTLADMEGGQYPPVMSVVIGPFATWGLTNGATVSSLTIDNGLIVGDGLLNLQGNVTNLGFSEIRCSLFLGNETRTFSSDDGGSFAAQLEVRGHILGPSSGANPPGIIKTGPGILMLKNQNTYSGRTLIEEGALYAMHPQALGTTAGDTRVGENTELLFGDFAANTPLTYTEPLLIEAGSLGAVSDAILTGPIRLDADGAISGPASGRLDLNTTITGPGGFVVRGGTVRLSGTASNTFAGAVLVQAGFFSPPVLELKKAVDALAIPTSVSLEGFGTNLATLRNLQHGGVDFVLVADGGWWDLHGNFVAPQSLTFRGAGTVDGGFDGPHPGRLIFGGSGVNTQLQVLPRSAGPPDYTARILGAVDFISLTNELTIPPFITLELAGEIYGLNVQKRGPGKLVLGGDNALLEKLRVHDGEVVCTHNHALGTDAQVLDGGTVWLTTIFPRGPITIEGRGFQGTNGALSVATGPVIFTGDVRLTGSAVMNTATADGQLFINGSISGTGPLAKDGHGLLVFQGTTANTFTGDTLVNAGTLELGKSPFLPAVPGNLVVSSGRHSAKVLYGNHDQVWNQITVNRHGIVDLNGWDEYSGDVTLNAGLLQTGNGTLHLGAGVNVFVNTGPDGDESYLLGKVALGAGVHRFFVGSTPHPFPDLTSDLVFFGSITEEGGFAGIIKEGAGKFTFNGANSFSGTFVINDGLVVAQNSSAFGSAAAGTIVNSNATLLLDDGIWVQEEPLTLNSVNPVAFGSLQLSNTWSGNITLQRTAGIRVASGILNLMGFFDCCGGIISGPGGITKSGPGALHISGFGSNSYAGPTVVNDGALEAWRILSPALPGDVIVTGTNSTLRTGRAPANTALASGASVTVKNGAAWQMNRSNSETLRALLGDGRAGIAEGFGNFAALTVDTTNSCEFSGALSGFGSLDKRGPATLFLSGQSLFYGGTSTVHQGTLRVDGRIAGSPVIVKSGAQLRGDGAVGNGTATEPDGVVRIDASFADHPDRQGGDLEVSQLSLGAGGVAAFDLFGTSPTGGNDLLIAHGPVNLGNARLSAGFNYPPREGDVLTLLQNNSPIPIDGIFNGWPEGITRKLGDVTVRASYRGGDGNDFTLTVTNLALALGGYRLAEGNDNQTVEPDECNLLFISLFHRRATALVVTNASLRATTPGAAVTISRALYPTIPAAGNGENLTPFQFRTDRTLPCGQPVEFELTLGVAGEGIFAVRLEVVAGEGPDCNHPTGGCESCFAVSGQFRANTPTLLRAHNFIGGPSLCFPPKRCPETNTFTDTVAVPNLTHSFTNNTTNELCLTAQLQFACPGAPTNALGAVAYLGTNDQHGPCVNFLGDTGADGTQPFSFRVPPLTNFIVLVSARAPNVVCPNYTLEVFGLPCPPPTLQIDRDPTPDKVQLQWSTTSPGFALQSTDALGAAAAFSNRLDAVSIANGRYTVTNATTSPRQFYRLFKP